VILLFQSRRLLSNAFLSNILRAAEMDTARRRGEFEQPLSNNSSFNFATLSSNACSFSVQLVH
jgi:hypothetical protein